MKVGYCEKCGQRVMIREAAGEDEQRHVLCDICREEAGIAQGAREPADSVQSAQRVRRKTNQYRRTTPGKGVPPVDVPPPAGSHTAQYVAAAMGAGLMLCLGLLAAYLIWGRGAATGPLVATNKPPDDATRATSPVLPARPAPASAEKVAGVSTGTAPAKETAGKEATEPADSAAQPKGRKPLGGWGVTQPPKIDEAPTEEADTEQPETSTGLNVPTEEPASQEQPGPANQADAPAETSAVTGESAIDADTTETPTAAKEPEIAEPPKEVPRMPPELATKIRDASEKHARYEVLDSIATLTRHYRFTEAAARLEKKAEEELLWAGVTDELRRASTVLRIMGESVRELEGKRIDVRLRIGRLSGVVKGYSPGMIRLVNDAGTPSMLSLKKAPLKFLRDLAGDASDEDFTTYCIYSGWGLPEGKSKAELSEAAQLVLDYPDWISREKQAETALNRLREMRKKEDWPELISASVEVALKHMDTYTVGVEARGELGGMLKEAIVKKKKTITYQRGAQPAEGYDGVKDTYISSYVVSPGNTEQIMNYGGKKDMVLWSTNRRTIIRFDLANLPKDAKVHGATLELCCSKMGYETKTTAALYLLAEGWEEGKGAYGRAKSGATWDFTDAVAQKRWSEAGGVVVQEDFGHGTPGIVTTAVVEPEKWITFDVTKGVAEWVSGRTPNHGFLIRLAAGAKGHVTFVSSEIDDPAMRPKLTLEYEGTVEGQEAVVPDDLQWLLQEAGKETKSEVEVDGTEI